MWVFVPCGVLVPIVIICIVCHIFFTVGPVVATVLFWVALIAGCAIIIGIAALVMYFFQDFGGIASFISIVFFIGVSTGTIYGAWYIDLRLHHKDKYTLMQENKNTPKEEERRTIPVELVYIGTIVGTYQPYHRVETKFNGIYYKLKNDPLLKGDTAFTLAKYSHENFPTYSNLIPRNTEKIMLKTYKFILTHNDYKHENKSYVIDNIDLSDGKVYLCFDETKGKFFQYKPEDIKKYTTVYYKTKEHLLGADEYASYKLPVFD